jgi:hypothetical protein
VEATIRRQQVQKQNHCNKITLLPSYFSGSRHYWIRILCRVFETLGKALFALGKGFAECCTWQRTHGKKTVGKAFFAECLTLGKV